MLRVLTARDRRQVFLHRSPRTCSGQRHCLPACIWSHGVRQHCWPWGSQEGSRQVTLPCDSDPTGQEDPALSSLVFSQKIMRRRRVPEKAEKTSLHQIVKYMIEKTRLTIYAFGGRSFVQSSPQCSLDGIFVIPSSWLINKNCIDMDGPMSWKYLRHKTCLFLLICDVA